MSKPRRPVKRKKISVFRLLTFWQRVMPDFLIIGAQKSGTTKLYENLVKHPQIIEAQRKEIHFFDVDKAYSYGAKYYRAFFPMEKELVDKARLLNKLVITGEATPDYLTNPQVPARAHSMIPDARLIVLLRNPIDMVHSYYQMLNRTNLDKTPTFEEALEKNPMYRTKGHYADFLQKWFRYFHLDQFLIIQSEKLFSDYLREFNTCVKFLGIEQVTKFDFAEPEDKQKYTALSAATRKDLSEYFKPHNQKLYELLGRSFDWD